MTRHCVWANLAKLVWEPRILQTPALPMYLKQWKKYLEKKETKSLVGLKIDLCRMPEIEVGTR